MKKEMEKQEDDSGDLIDEVLEGLVEEGGVKRGRCAEEVIEQAVIDFVKKFGVSLPIEYVNFLRKTNGAFFEDVVICYLWDAKLNELQPTQELFGMNERYRQEKLPKKYVVLGFSDEGLLVFNAMENFYALMESQGYGVLKKFESFEELFQETMEGAL